MALRAKILGSGAFLPPFPITNQVIGEFFPKPQSEEWTPSWVERKLGIKERRNSFDFNLGMMRSGYYDLDNAFAAAVFALEDANIEAKEIDRVLYATSTPEYLMPDPATMLHLRLGLNEDTPALGATAVGCGGFIYILDIADSEIRAGKYRTILLVGSVSVGPYIQAVNSLEDPQERMVLLGKNLINAYIFGEGAGSLILRAEEGEDGILFTYAGAHGKDNPVIFEGGGSQNPATHDTVHRGLHRFNMNVGTVKNVGPSHFHHTIRSILNRSGMTLKEIDHFVFHQVNYRLLKRIAHGLGIPWEKVIVHVDHYGNLDTATLPVAFHEGKESGRIKKGDLVLFAAIGAGWQYGSAIVRV